MSLSITNPYAYALTISDVIVHWNFDKGHQTGNNKTLTLLSASLGSTFWTGSIDAPSYDVPITGTLTLPAGTRSIVFNFDQIYDRPDGSEHITINFSTPGCQLYSINVGL